MKGLLSNRLKAGFMALLLVLAQSILPIQIARAADTPTPAPIRTVIDQGGANDVNAAQRDLTKMTTQWNGDGTLNVTWNWDKTGWSGANTGDACALFDSDADGNANYAVCVTVGGDPASYQSATLYSCIDNSDTNCNGSTVVKPMTTCNASVTSTDPFPNGEDRPRDTTASCVVTLSDVGGSGVANLVNVCSYPSQNPNSAYADCVRTDGDGYLRVVKTATPNDPSVAFVFNLGNEYFGETHGSGQFAVSVVSGRTYNLNEVIPAGWTQDSFVCDNGNSPANVTVAAGNTVTCTANNSKNIPTQPEAEVTTATETRQSCEAGVESRTITVTTNWTFDTTSWTWVKTAPVTTYGDWAFVRNLTPAEKAQLQCTRPTQPEAEVTTATETRQSCEAGVESRIKTTTVNYVFDETTWTWVPAAPVDSFSDWTFVRDLTPAEKAQLQCATPEEPTEIVTRSTEPRMTCEFGVENRIVTTTIGYRFDFTTWTWVQTPPATSYGDWTFVRELTPAEKSELGCKEPKITAIAICQPGNRLAVLIRNEGEADGSIMLGDEELVITTDPSDTYTISGVELSAAGITIEEFLEYLADQGVITDGTAIATCVGQGTVTPTTPVVTNVTPVTPVVVRSLPAMLPQTGPREQAFGLLATLVLGVLTYGAVYTVRNRVTR